MPLKAAFIFIAPEADPAQHTAIVKTPEVEVTTLAVASYAEAERSPRIWLRPELSPSSCVEDSVPKVSPKSNERSQARRPSASCVSTVTQAWASRVAMSYFNNPGLPLGF